MTFSDIIKDDMTTDNKPRFIWIRNGATTGNYVNVNHIVYVGKNLYKKMSILALWLLVQQLAIRLLMTNKQFT